MTNLQLFILSGVTAYLLYVNMHNDNQINSHNHIGADVTQPKKEPVKENVPIIADERPKPAKPIAIPSIETSFSKIQYHPTQGWINWDLMHNLGQPKFRTFQSKNYM